jgi:putative transposase
VWADGIHLKVRLAQDEVCLPVIVGVRADGTKELVALDDGHRESTGSWSDLLRSRKRRGMRAPVLAVVTARSGSGPRCATCSPRPENSGAGSAAAVKNQLGVSGEVGSAAAASRSLPVR